MRPREEKRQMVMSSKKKNREQTIFDNTIRIAREKGDEGSRNAKRIAGKVDYLSERPDFVISTDDGKTIGIEHFRADQLIKKDKKAQSASAELNSRARKEHERLVSSVKDDDVPPTNDFIDMVGSYSAEMIHIVKNSGICDLERSLQEGLFGKRGHASKLEAYYDNLAARNPSSKIELGYLIELHSEVTTLILNDGKSARKILPGEFPLSPEIYNLLRQASEDVDWILLAFCPSAKDEVVDAAIIQCSNGMFEESAREQGLQRTEYLGLVNGSPFVKQKKRGKVSHSVNSEGNLSLQIENTSQQIDMLQLCVAGLDGAARALELSQTGKPFVATISTQYVYELLRDNLRAGKKNMSIEDIYALIQKMSWDEYRKRSERFEANYFSTT